MKIKKLRLEEKNLRVITKKRRELKVHNNTKKKRGVKILRKERVVKKRVIKIFLNQCKQKKKLKKGKKKNRKKRKKKKFIKKISRKLSKS